MRLLLVLASLIAAFTVDCRDFSKTSGGQFFVDGKQNLTNGVQDITEEPENHESAIENQHLLYEPEDSISASHDLPDKKSSEDVDTTKGKKQLKKRSFFGAEVPQNLNYFDEEQQFDEENQEQSENRLRRSGCKARNACVVMGGFCVTNATLCSGRLVPDGCKGRNCQCCVPGTLELQISNLETELNSMKINLTNDNSAIKAALYSMKNNLTNDNSAMKSELLSMKNNLTNDNSEMKTELLSMKNNITDDNSELKKEFQSLKHNLTENNRQLKLKLSAMEDNIIAAISETGCPKGMFYFAPTHQCFKFINTQLSWTSANSKCQDEGLVLAKPLNPISLRAYIVARYDPSDYCWLGARGDGTYIRWLRGSQAISSSSPLWHGTPGSRVTTSDNLFLLTTASYVNSHPNEPYHSNKGTFTHYPICELIMD